MRSCWLEVQILSGVPDFNVMRRCVCCGGETIAGEEDHDPECIWYEEWINEKIREKELWIDVEPPPHKDDF